MLQKNLTQANRIPIVRAPSSNHHACSHKARSTCDRARVCLYAVLRLLVVHLLLSLPLRLHQREGMTWILALGLFAVIVGVHPATTGCKNCITLGKEEKAMFRAHSDACLPQSQVDPKLVEAMLNGELTDNEKLKRHVYCVLLKCKVIGKDGKLQKTAVLGKMANRADGKNATKVLEGCADQTGDTPEDIAWNLFRCGYDKKAVLFEYMPTNIAASDVENNSK